MSFLRVFLLLLTACLFSSCREKTITTYQDPIQKESNPKKEVVVKKTLEQSTKPISALLDPLKLATLRSDRAANSRFNKIMYHINRLTLEYDCKASKVIDSIYSHLPQNACYNGTQVYCPSIAKTNLTAQHRYATALGLFDTEYNLMKLKKGGSPIIQKGKYIGKITHVDHLIPRDVAPELENSFMNLTFLSSTENLKKSNKLTNGGLRRIQSLMKAGIGWKPSQELQARIDATKVK